MMQVCDTWQYASEPAHVSSEDESWLKQSRFKFSEDSDSDEGEKTVNEAYLQAVSLLKQVQPKLSTQNAPKPQVLNASSHLVLHKQKRHLNARHIGSTCQRSPMPKVSVMIMRQRPFQYQFHMQAACLSRPVSLHVHVSLHM